MTPLRRNSHRQSLSRPGFTIIEIVVVMAILVMMIGASFAFLDGMGHERSLREPCVEVESMAREAQARAIMTHTQQRIVVTGKSFLLMQKDQKPQEEEEWITLPVRKKVDLDNPDMRVCIYRWGSTTPVYPTESTPFVWVFPPDGFVEPITLHLSIEDSFIKQVYDPLTASVADEEMEIR